MQARDSTAGARACIVASFGWLLEVGHAASHQVRVSPSQFVGRPHRCAIAFTLRSSFPDSYGFNVILQHREHIVCIVSTNFR